MFSWLHAACTQMGLTSPTGVRKGPMQEALRPSVRAVGRATTQRSGVLDTRVAILCILANHGPPNAAYAGLSELVKAAAALLLARFRDAFVTPRFLRQGQRMFRVTNVNALPSCSRSMSCTCERRPRQSC